MVDSPEKLGFQESKYPLWSFDRYPRRENAQAQPNVWHPVLSQLSGGRLMLPVGPLPLRQARNQLVVQYIYRPGVH